VSHQVFRDRWGIPHLRADSAHELAFAQGRNVAIDRAWQLEIERRRSQGTSAALLGADAVGWDRFARQCRLDDTAQRCFRRLRGETRAWVTAYVDGVNAGLDDGAKRAPELVGKTLERWQPWTPLGIWLSTHILFAGFPTKLWREEVATCLGVDAITMFATDGMTGSGSNGWLVAGDHTSTGRAVMAGDPHRFIEDPGVYQQIHLACPDYDVVGLAVPGVPGLAHFGHTGGVAWAITNAMADCQDLYREQLRRTGAELEALGPDGWRSASVHVETIEVANAAPVDVEVIETDRGPVVIGGPSGDLAISLRYPPRVREDLGFDALPLLLAATTVDDVDRALELWVEPVNVVQAADTRGGLLHRVAGRVPVRHPDNRLRVVPAWLRDHDWRGWHAPLPRAPVDSIAVMANQRGLATPLGVEFAPTHRADRIRQLLSAHATWSAADMPAIHMDTLLASSGPLLAILAGLDDLGADAARLRDRLVRWNRRMDADSHDAALYATVRSAVVQRLAAHPALAALAALPAERSYPSLFWPWLALVPRVAFALEHLLGAEHLLGIDRPAIVRAALEDVALREPTTTWGERHRLLPWQAHPVEQTWPPLAGDHDCVLSTMSIPGVTDLSPRGPAARYVWDLARRDDSAWVVPLGASGVPGDPHHRDQLSLWLRGALVPVITNWEQLRQKASDGESP